MKLRILLASLTLGLTALAAETGAELFQKAVTAERAAGNLEEAIKLYQRVVKEFASDRALAARALVQEARCYEKLGQDKAVTIYEQVARDYRDQREPSAAASARLAALRLGDRAAQPAAMTQRKIEIAGAAGIIGLPSSDGQRAIYRDIATGAVMISDLARKNQRVVFKPKPGDAFVFFLPSRDFSMVALGFRPPKDPRGAETLAIVKTDGTGYREVARMEVPSQCATAWSWDNRYILDCASRPDGTTSLVVISVSDGQIREVLRKENTRIRTAAFSPDGRFIAYSEGTSVHGIFVLPSQGGEPQLISDNADLLDWTHDGRFLAVTSPHSGTMALHLLPVKDGKRAGEPVFVRYGSFLRGLTTSNGALIYHSLPAVGFSAWIADLDPDGHPGDWKRLILDTSVGPLWTIPTWSPDGSQFAYIASRGDAGQTGYVVRLQNLATGKERDLYRGAGLMLCVWAARHSNIFCSEVTTAGATNILSIAVDSGQVEQLGSIQGEGWLKVPPGPDDQSVHIARAARQDLIRWDIGTRQETVVEPFTTPAVGSAELSWDGGWLKRIENGNLEIRSVPGGDWKPLLPLRAQSGSGFTPDGKSILYHDVDAAGKDGLYRVAMVDGRPERLGDFPTNSVPGLLRVSPNGHKIIAVGAPGLLPDLWLLENFVPKAQSAR